MYALLISIHVIVSIMLIVVILMQSSKGGGLAGAFGGGGSTSAIFGGRGAANFLQKVTVSLAVSFMVLAIIIGFMSKPGNNSESLIQSAARERAAGQGSALPAPAAPPSLNTVDTTE